MNFSEFRKKVRQILAVDLPSWKSIIKQVRSMAGDIKIGRTAFMDKMGVDSELAYKQQCLKEYMDRRKVTIPVVLGGILNQKVENQALPVDVCGDLKKLGFNPCPKLEGNFKKLIESYL